MNDKKIALCISGQPRFIDDGFLEIKKNILDRYDTDIFIHTWWDPTYVGKDFNLSSKLSYNRTCKWDINTLSKLKEYYNPKKFTYEPQKNFNILDNVNYGLLNPISPYSMFYSIKCSNDLKKEYEYENKIKYDIVIRSRFDIKFKIFNLDLFQINTDFIYVSGELHRGGQINIPNDQFAMSSSENMDYYSVLFDNMVNYRENGLTNFSGESLLKFHLVDFGKKNIKFCNEDELYNTIIIK